MTLNDDVRIKEFLAKKYRYSKSYSTTKYYEVLIKKFQDFMRSRYSLSLNDTIQSMEAKKLDPIDILDEFYTFLSESKKTDGKQLSNRTIKGSLGVAKEFLNSQGLHIYNEDVRQRFRPPKIESVYEEGLTKEIIVRLLHNSPPKLQTAILMCASGGMRIGELVQLRISDVDFTSNPTIIRLRKETTKTKETRITCISTETTKTLKDYLKRSLGWAGTSTDHYIFMKNDKNYDDSITYSRAVISMKVSLIRSLDYVVSSVPELAKKNENGRSAIHFHALRAWFKTQVTDAHESDFAEALMGHKSLKLVYYRQNSTVRAETYQKVEPALTVSDFTSIEKTLKGVSEKQRELEEKIDRLEKERLQVPDFLQNR